MRSIYRLGELIDRFSYTPVLMSYVVLIGPAMVSRMTAAALFPLGRVLEEIVFFLWVFFVVVVFVLVVDQIHSHSQEKSLIAEHTYTWD